MILKSSLLLEIVKIMLHFKMTWIYFINSHFFGGWGLMLPSVNICISVQLTIMVIDNGTSHKNLGILFDSHLRFHDHSTEVTAKANWVLGVIKKSFEYLESTMLTKLFTMLVWHILEYSNAIWGPHFVLDQRKVENYSKEPAICFH